MSTLYVIDSPGQRDLILKDGVPHDEHAPVLARVLGKNPETTIVIIEEVETENWGIAGQPVSERRKQEV